MGKKKGGAPPAKAAKKTTAKKGKGARATRQNRGGATNQPAIDFTQGASFPMYGMGMGMAPLMGGTGGMGGGVFPPFSSPGFGMMPAGPLSLATPSHTDHWSFFHVHPRRRHDPRYEYHD